MGLHVDFPYKIICFPPWRRMLGALWPHCRIPVHGVGGELPFAGCSQHFEDEPFPGAKEGEFGVGQAGFS